MSLDKIDRAFNTVARGVDLLVTLACIVLAGVIAFVVLGLGGMTGVALYGLTAVVALAGGLVVRLVLRLLLFASDL
ncbi:MAG: hypothetical protein WBG08_11390 [Litorimonas sp.]